MKYLVTGGSGFIASWFCERLRAAGHEIVILDLVEPLEWTVHDTFIQGDIRDPEAMRRAMPGCDRVVNLAAAHHDFGIADETYFDVNERGSQVVCDVMDECGVRDVVFYSTVALYGDSAPPLEETTPPAPNSPYGASKLAGEKVFEAWTEKGAGRRCLVIRPTVTFGPRNFANVYSLIRQIHSGKFVFVGDASNIKSLSYIENIVDATLFLMEKDGLPPFDVYNYVEKPDLTSRQIAETIFASMNRKAPGWRIPMWTARLLALPFDVVIALTGRNLPISGARVKKLFQTQTLFESQKVRDAGFEPAVPLAEGLDRMVKWYLATGKDLSSEWHQPPAEVWKPGS